MKKIFFLLSLSAILYSCEKDKCHEKDKEVKNLCPIVLKNSVPLPVQDSFAVRYPADVVSTWFFKDSSNYAALFTDSGIEKLAQFSINGAFISEQIEIQQEGDHQDSTSAGKSEGCKCEVPDKEGE
ncbi:MAG: hypothetical protein M3Z01_08980 [Thermoproteota archaeon]|nr:hypothetical protein [Thermoproteota archaeon]